jgi:4-hydroxyacetophenone monooxygenase
MAAAGITSIDVREDVHDEYVQRVDAEHEQLIWTHPGVSNWYRNRHGRVVFLLPWRLVDYWGMTHDPDFDDYRVTVPLRVPDTSRDL